MTPNDKRDYLNLLIKAIVDHDEYFSAIDELFPEIENSLQLNHKTYLESLK